MELFWAGSAAGSSALEPLEAASIGTSAGDFLQKKFDSGDPLRMYAAFRIWNGYLLAREPAKRAEACDRFMEKWRLMHNLCKRVELWHQ